MQVKKNHTNEFTKFQAYKNPKRSNRKIFYFYISTILLASDVVHIWRLIEQPQSVIVVVKGK